MEMVLQEAALTRLEEQKWIWLVRYEGRVITGGSTGIPPFLIWSWLSQTFIDITGDSDIALGDSARILSAEENNGTGDINWIKIDALVRCGLQPGDSRIMID